MNKQSILTQLDQIKLVYSHHRAYLSLAIEEARGINYFLIRNELFKASYPEVQIAKLQADISIAAAMLWSLLHEWDTEHRIEYQTTVKDCFEKILITGSLKDALLSQKPLKQKSFRLDGKILGILRNTSFHFYLGSSIGEKEFIDCISFQQLDAAIKLLTSTDLNDIAGVQKAVHLIGKNESIDLKNIRAAEFSNKRLN
jgi:hypothetical protein